MPDPEHNISCGGLTAGIAMNLNRTGQIGLMDRTVSLSFLLLIWLVMTTFFEFYYSPSSHSRKAIYMTFASLGFLILACGSTEHIAWRSQSRDE